MFNFLRPVSILCSDTSTINLMCLILFAHNVHPDYPMIVAANRDEFYSRPTEPAQYWTGKPGLLAGRDLQAGGTWLGITRSGRFAAITNYREGEKSDTAHSRGRITLDFLLSSRSAEEHLLQLQKQSDDYAGFNLLAGGPGALHYFGNRAGPQQSLADGIYALGNGTLWDDWHKMHKGKSDFSRAISREIDREVLLQLMVNETRSPDGQLPSTGVSLEMERLLSARFIRAEHYGTRATTVLLVDRAGRVSFIEQNYVTGGVDGEPRSFEFQLRR